MLAEENKLVNVLGTRHMISDISPLLSSLRGTECRGNLGGASGGVFRFPSPPIHRDCFASLAKTKWAPVRVTHPRVTALQVQTG